MTAILGIAKLDRKPRGVQIARASTVENAMHIDSAPHARLVAGVATEPGLPAGSAWLRRCLMLLFRRAVQPSATVETPAPVAPVRRTSSPATRMSTSAANSSMLVPMDPERLSHACLSLRRILECHPAAPTIWPSIALVDRAVGTHGGSGIERLQPKVLQDAGRVLNRLMDELCEHGVVVLLERIDHVLRVVHGITMPAETRWQAVRPAEIQVLESTITEFMEIDRAWDEQLLAEDAESRRKG
jgi:hypothetical protein